MEKYGCFQRCISFVIDIHAGTGPGIYEREAQRVPETLVLTTGTQVLERVGGPGTCLEKFEIFMLSPAF